MPLPQPECCDLRVTVLAANEIVRHGLHGMLDRLPAVKSVLACETPSEAAHLLSEEKCDVLILSLGESQPDDSSSCQVARDAYDQGVKVLLVLEEAGIDALDALSRIPSNGFLIQREVTTGVLAASLTMLKSGDMPLPPMLARRLLQQTRYGPALARSQVEHLTPRERQVLLLLVEGCSNKQIAQRLDISQHGVKRLVSNVLAKLNCPNRTLAATTALATGMLS